MSTSMKSITYFHTELIFYLIFITVFVLFMLLRTLDIFEEQSSCPLKVKYKVYYDRLTHHVGLEVVWTVVPTLLLCQIMSASFALLYSLEELNNPELTIKVIGHQWYWSYEISHLIHKKDKSVFYHIDFDSYITQDEDLKLRKLRLMQVDRYLILPAFTQIRLNFTGADVIHS